MEFVFQAVVALAFPYFSWGLPVCLGSRRHRFLRSVCLSGRDRYIFFCRRRIPNSSPVCSGTFIIRHWEKIAAFPKIAVLIFFLFVQWSKYAGVDVSTVVNLRKAVCEQISRESDYLSQELNSGQDRAHITLVSLLVPPNVAAVIDQHISNSDPNGFWRERETERLFNSIKGIMIDNEQLNPLVGWRSLTLPSPHHEWKAKVFFFFNKGWLLRFFGSPSWYASYYRFRGEHRSVIV